MDLTGASALVTGGASGLGLATARRLAASGAAVTIVDLPASAGAGVADELGGTFAPADVTDPDQVAAAVAAAAAAPARRARAARASCTRAADVTADQSPVRLPSDRALAYPGSVPP